MSNLWLLSGERRHREEAARDYSKLGQRGIEVVNASIEAIDPASRTVRTTAGTLQADYLVVALGASRSPQSLSGFAECAFDLYDAEGAKRAHDALQAFRHGRIVILVTRTPISCPAAPYEAAFLIDSLFRSRGLRDGIEIEIYTPEDRPMPVAGAHVGSALATMLEERGVALHPEQIPMKIDVGSRRVLFELEDASFDILLGVPPHVAPAAVRESGLTDASGWIPVDATTLATRYAGVYAIGDVTAIRLANGMFLPKAGVFADAEARVVAERIAGELNDSATARSYDGRGFCYIEVGNGQAAYGVGTFYGTPGPRISLESPSHGFRREKVELERNTLALLE
jgi:sulfide:quinone oxidoreductase